MAAHFNFSPNYKLRSKRLKYVIVNVHNTQIANIVRFLGMFDHFGYFKHTRFSSSVRFELMMNKSDGQKNYFVRMVYDNEEFKFPHCKG